ncbi:MAG: phage terminase small subunit [Clostridiales bacterium]|nr:phage terminase small subunit [Clostridiales bacterium]
MPRKRNPARDKALEIWLKKKGKITPTEIAEQLGVTAKQVREWKCKDKWEDKLPKRGGQRGNRNAAGHGAPKGNTNAQTHGAYSFPRVENWTEEERARLEQMPTEFQPIANQQLKRLLAKQEELERRIAALDDEDEENPALFLDRVTTMKLPNGGEMKYKMESSAFSRRMVLEAELNRVHGRIQKLMDSIRTWEEAQKRMALEREKFTFTKQKTLGQFNMDENGELLEEPEDEDDEIIK